LASAEEALFRVCAIRISVAVVPSRKALIFIAINAVANPFIYARAGEGADGVGANAELVVAVVNPARTFVNILRRFRWIFRQCRGRCAG
jgi:hypothetical protein